MINKIITNHKLNDEYEVMNIQMDAKKQENILD